MLPNECSGTSYAVIENDDDGSSTLLNVKSHLIDRISHDLSDGMNGVKDSPT
jgi:hypothetical protein